jgi:uncharacterized membrane protein
MKKPSVFKISSPRGYIVLIIWIGILLFGGKFVLRDALPYFGFDEEVFGRYWDFKWTLIGHVSGGMLALIIGPFQFWKAFRHNYIKVHRVLGTVYVAAIIIGSLSATYISWTSAIEVHLSWVISLQGLAFAWFCTVAMAVKGLYQRRYKIHKEWMIRSYVVTFAFVLFRWLNGLAYDFDLGSFVERGPTIIWISWAIPLFITEIILQWNKK